MALTEQAAEVVMSVLYDRVLELKAENDFGNEFDEEIQLLQNAIDEIDQWIIKEGYDA